MTDSTDPQSDSDLKARISAETIAAMKARDKARVANLRMINAEIKRVEVDERRVLSDGDVLTILNKMLKQRQDALAQYEGAGRQDLADKEAAEIELIQTFLPAQLSEDEQEALIAKCITDLDAKGMQDMGKVMGRLKELAQGQMDMGRASAAVKAQLQAL